MSAYNLRRAEVSDLPLFDAARGRAERDAGLALAELHNDEFVRRMRAEAEAIAAARGEVHIDDVRARAVELGISPTSSAAWGCVFSQRGKWRKRGYRPSALKTNHGHVSPVWELA